MLGALPDEAVKKNLPGAGFLGRESLRAEPERKSANGKAAPQGGRATKKRAPFGARFFLVHFQGLSRPGRVAAVCAPWGPPAALRRCPALRLAVSATSGARLRAPWAR